MDSHFVLIFTTTCITSGAVAAFAWRRRPARGASLLAFFMLAVAAWSGTTVTEVLSNNPAYMAFLRNIGVSISLVIPPLWLLFSLQYTGRERWLKPHIIGILMVVTTTLCGLLWTNDYHGTVWKSMATEVRETYLILAPEVGTGFWVFVIFSYWTILLGSFILVDAILRLPNLTGGQVSSLAIGALAPLGSNMLNVTGMVHFRGLNLIFVGFTISGIAMALGLFRFKILDIIPLARGTLIQKMSDPVLVLDPQDRIVETNPAARTLIEDMRLGTARSLMVHLRSEAEPGFGETKKEILLGREGYARWFDLGITPLYGDQNQITGKLIVLRDITNIKNVEKELRNAQDELETRIKKRTLELEETNKALEEEVAERKRTEEALRRERDKANQYLEVAQIIILALNKAGKVTLVNPKGCEVLGYSQEELIGSNWFEKCLPQGVRKEAKDVFATLIAGKLNHYRSYENPIKRKDGQERIISWYHTLLRTKEGRIIGTLSSGVDITERKRAEEELQASEEKFRLFFENEPEYCYMISRNGEIMDINGAALEALGYEKRELVGQPLSTIYAPESIPKMGILFKEWKRTGILKNEEMKIITRDGRRRIVLLSASAVRDRRGKIKYSLSVQRDITEIKDAQEQLKRYSEQLEEIIQEKTRQLQDAEKMAAVGETAAMVGHDLRNPLQAIINNIYLARKKLNDIEDNEEETQSLSEYLKSISEGVSYMNKIVLDLQDFARPMEPRLARTNLGKLIHEMVQATEIPENIKLSVKASQTPTMNVDPDLMKRVIQNLFSNAVQAMPEGGQLTIEIGRGKREGVEHVFIKFTDTGVGIPEENLDKLFRPLFTTKAQGQGFGLAVCKRIVQAHGGDMKVESFLGQGTTFTVRIPLAVGLMDNTGSAEKGTMSPQAA